MEWIQTKIAIILLGIVVLVVLMTFHNGFSEVLEKDKQIHDAVNDKRINEMKDIVVSLSSSVTVIIIIQIKTFSKKVSSKT